MFAGRFNKHHWPVALAMCSLFVASCGGKLIRFGSGSPTAPVPAKTPMAPVLVAGSYLTAVLVDENHIAVRGVRVRFSPNESPAVTDEQGKANITFSETPPSEIDLGIEFPDGTNVTARVSVPDDVKNTVNAAPENIKHLLVTIAERSSIATAAVAATAPIVKSLTAGSILADGDISLTEQNSTDAAIRQAPLYTADVAGSASNSFALLRSEQVCDSSVNFSFAQIPSMNDALAFVQAQGFSAQPLLRICMKFSSSAATDTIAQSQPFSVQWDPASQITFVNDSEGQYARFFWKDTSSIAAENVVLAYSQDPSQISSWLGATTLITGLTFVEDFSACSDASYRSSDSGDFQNTSGKCGFDLSSGGVTPWGKRHFRFFIKKTSGSSFLSKVFTVGHVPKGMVLVAKESWPAEYTASNDASHYDGHSVREPFDFAIDKYEATDVTVGSKDLASYTFNSANTDPLKLVSQAGTLPAATSYSWYAFKQGCENRTKDSAFATGFVDDSQVRRSFHLATDLEWFVASTGTPDLSGAPYCNSDGALSQPLNPGDPQSSLCLSDSGARDLIGNLLEWTDGRWTWDSVTSSITREIFHGTQAVISSSIVGPNGGAKLKSSEKYVGGWNALLAFPTLVSSAPQSAFYSDQFTFFTPNTTLSDRSGSLRGGYFKNNVTNGSGRHTLRLDYKAQFYGQSMDFVGGRCALVAP